MPAPPRAFAAMAAVPRRLGCGIYHSSAMCGLTHLFRRSDDHDVPPPLDAISIDIPGLCIALIAVERLGLKCQLSAPVISVNQAERARKPVGSDGHPLFEHHRRPHVGAFLPARA